MTLSVDASRGVRFGGGCFLPGDPGLGQQFGEVLLVGPAGQLLEDPFQVGARGRLFSRNFTLDEDVLFDEGFV